MAKLELDPPDAVSPAGAVDEAARETDADELVIEELLVEEVSIDGMCGVY